MNDDQRKRVIGRIAAAHNDSHNAIVGRQAAAYEEADVQVVTRFHCGAPGCVVECGDRRGPAASTVDDALLKTAALWESESHKDRAMRSGLSGGSRTAPPLRRGVPR